MVTLPSVVYVKTGNEIPESMEPPAVRVAVVIGVAGGMEVFSGSDVPMTDLLALSVSEDCFTDESVGHVQTNESEASFVSVGIVLNHIEVCSDEEGHSKESVVPGIADQNCAEVVHEIGMPEEPD